MSKLKTTKIALFVHHSHDCRNAAMLSLGLVSECGKTFYAEFTDFDEQQFTTPDDKDLILHNTLRLRDVTKPFCAKQYNVSELEIVDMYSSKEEVAKELLYWLDMFDISEFVGCDMTYQWMLFLDLIGDKLPNRTLSIPVDINVVLRTLYGVDMPDIHTYSGMLPEHNHPTALDNARIVMGCYKNLVGSLDALYDRAGLSGMPDFDKPDFGSK